MSVEEPHPRTTLSLSTMCVCYWIKSRAIAYDCLNHAVACVWMCDHVRIYINVMNAVDYAGGVHAISMAELFIANWDWKWMKQNRSYNAMRISYWWEISKHAINLNEKPFEPLLLEIVY